MDKIKYYKNNGELDHEELLSEDTLGGTAGMLIKCYMNDGTTKVGYSDPYRTHEKYAYNDFVHDYIYLWTWDNLDEDKHELVGNEETKYNQTFEKVIIKKINTIEAMLFSNPKWGGRLTNKFEFVKKDKKESLPPYIKLFEKHNFDYKDDKYEVFGFKANPREVDQYVIENDLGGTGDIFWIFSINDKLIKVANTGNFDMDSYSAVVLGNYLHFITDFDYYRIDMDTLELDGFVELSGAPFDEIYKFYNGMVVIGEMDIVYIEDDMVKWKAGNGGIIDYAIVSKDNTITVSESEPYSSYTLNKDGKEI